MYQRVQVEQHLIAQLHAIHGKPLDQLDSYCK